MKECVCVGGGFGANRCSNRPLATFFQLLQLDAAWLPHYIMQAGAAGGDREKERERRGRGGEDDEDRQTEIEGKQQEVGMSRGSGGGGAESSQRCCDWC